ncbi:START domain [Sesbania bispinosa]|nr:START domain [Sesbania bispinosa]
MNTEFHLPTALVRSRECYFARYCKQLSHEKWVVTDVSLEKFFPSPSNNFRKRPSGCLITGMPNGFSKVVWIEHVEADHSQLSDNFKPLVTSCLAFGAPCWIASLVRHSKWFQSLNAPTAYADQGGEGAYVVVVLAPRREEGWGLLQNRGEEKKKDEDCCRTARKREEEGWGPVADSGGRVGGSGGAGRTRRRRRVVDVAGRRRAAELSRGFLAQQN